MIIYADILFITNLYIDFFLLLCVKKFLRLKVTGMRMLAGALVGAAYSLCAMLPAMPGILSLAAGIVSAFLIALVTFAPNNIFVLLRASLCFYVFSFIFAGFFFFIYFLFTPDNLAVRNGLVYIDLSPALVFGFTLLAYIVTIVFRRLFRSGDSHSQYLYLKICHYGKESRVFAKSDSGNSLREPFSGLPVIIVEEKSLAELIPKDISNFLDNGSAAESLRLVPFSAMGGSGILPAFKPEAVLSDKNELLPDCYVAVCRNKLSAGQFEALYPPDLLINKPSDHHDLNGGSKKYAEPSSCSGSCSRIKSKSRKGKLI